MNFFVYQENRFRFINDKNRLSRLAKNLFFILFLFLWTFILRVPTFLNSVINWDESLYLLMADQWLSGNLPYSTVWDHKPIGIYLIFYLAISLFGRSVLAIRLIAILFVFGTSLALFFISSELFRCRKTAMMSAIIYPVFTLGLGGLASNTEIFFICFNLMALLLLLYAHKSRSNSIRFYLTFFTAGLFFGCALQIKYIVVFEVLFFLFLFFIIQEKQSTSLKVNPIRKIQQWSVMSVTVGSGLIAPTLLVMLYFWVNDRFESFFYANFVANFYHLQASSFSYVVLEFMLSMLEWVAWILIISMGFLIDGFRRHKTEWPKKVSLINSRQIFSFLKKLNRVQIFLFLWLLVTLLEAWVTRKFYGYYYLVTIPPLCLLLAQQFIKRETKPFSDRKLITSTVKFMIIPIIFVLIFDYSVWLYRRVKNNGTEKVIEVSEYISENISSSDYIYTVNDEPILYFLTNARLPTRYPFPPHLLSPHFNQVSNVDYEFEVNRILNLHPKFVLIWDDDDHAQRIEEIRQKVDKEYTIDRVYEEVTIYKIASHAE